MRYTASSRLSAETQAIMDGQTAVKQYVKDAYMRGVPFSEVLRRLPELLKDVYSEIKDEYLRKESEKSFEALARRTYATMQNSYSFGNIPLLLAVIGLYNRSLVGTAKAKAERLIANAPPTIFGMTTQTAIAEDYKLSYGTKVQLRVRYYMRDVSKTVQQLAGLKAENESEAQYTVRKNSLRATAEMVVRENGHIAEIDELRRSGEKLVIISTHADCSDRCAPWQGRVYSLDGTSGTAPDGRKFVPLETATDIYYTTKAGKVWRNGLFGFNCRHRAYAYGVGFVPPTISEKERKRQVAIDQRQREFERRIVKAREQAIAFRNVDNKRYKQWKAYATKLFKEYADYSRKNGRSYYTSRIRIL